MSFTRDRHRDDGTGQPRDVLVWRFDEPARAISSAVCGGGIREVKWVLNAEVALAYRRMDPERHVGEIAAELGLDPSAGAGLLTAAPVAAVTSRDEAGAHAEATVGLSFPVWAAAAADVPLPPRGWTPGTINLVCALPVALSDAALVNAVITATEAKSQALIEAGVPGTGTASDAVVVCCPRSGPVQAFTGPRSLWGARLARAVHGAVSAGVAEYAARP